jgi:DinB superfamily
MMMQKPIIGEYNPFFQRYIDKTSDGDFGIVWKNNTEKIVDFFKNIPFEKHDYRYAEGKWSLKEVLMHLIDTERVMAFRGFTAARGDNALLPGFDENEYAKIADVTQRTMIDLIEEFETVRKASTVLFLNITDEQSKLLGNANHHAFSARAAAYICMGHPLHHISVIEERYL